MKLFLVSRVKYPDWDQFISFVCAAANEQDALATHPRGADFFDTQGGLLPQAEWTDEWSRDLTVKHIGEAAAGITGVVCASYLHG